MHEDEEIENFISHKISLVKPQASVVVLMVELAQYYVIDTDGRFSLGLREKDNPHSILTLKDEIR